MEKVVFTSSLLKRYSTLEDLKNRFNSNNISLLDYLNETLEMATNNTDILDKRLVIYGVFFEFLKIIQTISIFILKQLLKYL